MVRIQRPPTPRPAQDVSGSSPLTAPTLARPADTIAPAPALAPRTAAGEFHGGGLPPSLLGGALQLARREVHAVHTAALPDDVPELLTTYGSLGDAMARAQAVLLSALDALDARTGGGVARPAAPYQKLRAGALELLRDLGEVFARLEPAFASLVHGGGGWPSQPVVVAADRGDGEPLRHYRNTYKRDEPLDLAAQEAEYQKRVDKFVSAGGRFEDILVGRKGLIAELEDGLRYDYVVAADGTVRLFPNERDDDSGPPKPGHSLLAVGGPRFDDDAAVMAGELFVFRDSAGDVEAVVVANNSGHFKPSWQDLPNAIPALRALGVPDEKLVLCGGPNNLPAMFGEIGRKFPDVDVPELPPSPREMLQRLAQAGTARSLALQLRR